MKMPKAMNMISATLPIKQINVELLFCY